MPKCTNCNKKWSWKQTVNRTFILNAEMTCSHCRAKQYHSKRSKAKAPLLRLIVLTPLPYQAFLDVPLVMLFSLFPMLAAAVRPFIVELSSDA